MVNESSMFDSLKFYCINVTDEENNSYVRPGRESNPLRDNRALPRRYKSPIVSQGSTSGHIYLTR